MKLPQRKLPKKKHLQKNQPQRQQRGNRGEQRARKHLQNKGYQIIESNWHARWAEIDIVAIDGDQLVFIEVKTRYSHERGRPEEAMTPHKLRTLTRAAHLYKQQHPEHPDAMRLDFVGVDFSSSATPEIRHISNVGY